MIPAALGHVVRTLNSEGNPDKQAFVRAATMGALGAASFKLFSQSLESRSQRKDAVEVLDMPVPALTSDQALLEAYTRLKPYTRLGVNHLNMFQRSVKAAEKLVFLANQGSAGELVVGEEVCAAADVAFRVATNRINDMKTLVKREMGPEQCVAFFMVVRDQIFPALQRHYTNVLRMRMPFNVDRELDRADDAVNRVLRAKKSREAMVMGKTRANRSRRDLPDESSADE
jgi:hypothetical protein